MALQTRLGSGRRSKKSRVKFQTRGAVPMETIVEQEYPPEMMKWVHQQIRLAKMKRVVREATDAQKFYEDTVRHRQKDQVAEGKFSRIVSSADDEDIADELPPVFNKRLFASQGAVVLTPEARKIMCKNGASKPEVDPKFMSKSELLAMRAVVEGLKLIHKGKDYIKDCLSHVVTYESFAPWQYVTKKSYEECLSCYYIVNGAVEVTYGINVTASMHVYQPNIIYNQGSGEYLGLVSPEGRMDDLAPPATIYTKEACEFLRIDRTKFHRMIDKILSMEAEEKRKFLASGLSALSYIPTEAKERVLPQLLKQEYPPNRTIVNQEDYSEHLYIIVSGRCHAHRQVFVPESEKDVTFYMAQLTTGHFFAEECVLERESNVCTVTTTCHTVCYKLHRSCFEIINKEHLKNIIHQYRNDYATDVELHDKGYSTSVWNSYKHREVKGSLKEGGRTDLLYVKQTGRVSPRPPVDRDIYRENMYRFMLKGSRMQPVRARSAINRPLSSQGSLPIRPKSALDRFFDDNISEISENDTEPESPADVPERRSSKTTMVRMLEKHQIIQPDGKSGLKDKKTLRRKEIDRVGSVNSLELHKFFQENTELTKQLKSAWVDDLEQESIEKNFMDNGVLVSMDSDEIVRKAKAIANTFADKVKPKKKARDEVEEEWDTILHAEHKQAKVYVAVSKYRTETLRQNIHALQRKRQKDRMKGRLPSRSLSEEPHGTTRKKIKGFVLDRIANGLALEVDDDEENDSDKDSPLADALMISSKKKSHTVSRGSGPLSKIPELDTLPSNKTEQESDPDGFHEEKVY